MCLEILEELDIIESIGKYFLIEKMSFCRFSVSFRSISLNTITFSLDEEICRAHFSKYCKSYFPTTQINGFSYTISEADVPSFTSSGCSEYFRKHRWKSPILVMTACGNFTFKIQNLIFVFTHSVNW